MQTPKSDFKVYKRKIYVYREATALDQVNETDNYNQSGIRWVYAYPTNAYKTCKAAIEAAKISHPGKRFTANFAKDQEESKCIISISLKY